MAHPPIAMLRPGGRAGRSQKVLRPGECGFDLWRAACVFAMRRPWVKAWRCMHTNRRDPVTRNSVHKLAGCLACGLQGAEDSPQRALLNHCDLTAHDMAHTTTTTTARGAAAPFPRRWMGSRRRRRGHSPPCRASNTRLRCHHPRRASYKDVMTTRGALQCRTGCGTREVASRCRCWNLDFPARELVGLP